MLCSRSFLEMSTEEKKPSYINIAADLTLLQRIVCCNHDITVSPADTPRSRPKTPINTGDTGLRKEVEIALEENFSE